jgi:DNA topoisomerase-1
LTTLREDHVDAGRRRVSFDFVGKSGQHHELTLDDARLARIVRKCHELGGKELFTYMGDDGPLAVSSADVNVFLRDLTGMGDVSAKDFRTWGGTATVTEVLAGLGAASTARERDANVLVALDAAAARLHNTRAVCRSCYVHPAIASAYEEERLGDIWASSRRSRWYSRAEAATLRLLQSSPALSDG